MKIIWHCSRNKTDKCAKNTCCGVTQQFKIYPRCEMTVRQVSIQCGISVDTIRYYERIGLIAVEKGSYFKNYSKQTVDELIAIKRLRSAGLSIEEIKCLLSIDVEPTDLSQKQLDSISVMIDNALERTKIRAKEVAESQQLLKRMKNKLNTVKNEDN